MSDLFRKASSNGNATNVTVRGNIKMVAGEVRVVTEAYGENYVIIPEGVSGTFVDGDPCLVIYDELRRPWVVGATGTGLPGTGEPELYVQTMAPDEGVPTPYVWIELGNPVGGWTVWFEDGT